MMLRLNQQISTLMRTTGQILPMLCSLCVAFAVVAQESPQFNLTHLPFSRYGSWLALNMEKAEGPLILRDVNGVFGSDAVATITFSTNGNSVFTTQIATPQRVIVTSSAGRAELWLIGDHALAISTVGLDVVLRITESKQFATGATNPVPQVWHLASNSELHLQPICAVIATRTNGFTATSRNGKVQLALAIGLPGRFAVPSRINCETDTADAMLKWNHFRALLPKMPSDRSVEAEQAWFNLWSCFMRREGVFQYESVLMSKSVMTYVWSWDHCFVALALAKSNPEAALDQWMLPFPLMNDKGCLPDMWKPPQTVEWYATKPPIHGWALSKLMDTFEIPRPRLQQAYNYLVKWTEFWMKNRDSDGDGVPNYLVAGNDSGWDNATLFDIGTELESPDLSAYLILQMKCLERVARKLDQPEAAEQWKSRADKLKADFLRHSWDGEQFVAKLSKTHTFDPEPTSLLSLMPLVLGEQLDAFQFKKLAARLEKEFLTEHGLATEQVRSPKYQSAGYWRGPIWAPSTYLLVDGLARGGRNDLAREIARRFCDMIKQKAGGNYENFDAQTGRGLCAPGYTWTAAVNLLLMKEYLCKVTPSYPQNKTKQNP